MFKNKFKTGDWVVYRKLKRTSQPGRRAQIIRASTKGEGYTYLVEKFWIVAKVLSDGNLVLETRRGKTHLVNKSDPNLRRATWWDRIRYRERFTRLEQLRFSK